MAIHRIADTAVCSGSCAPAHRAHARLVQQFCGLLQSEPLPQAVDGMGKGFVGSRYRPVTGRYSAESTSVQASL